MGCVCVFDSFQTCVCMFLLPWLCYEGTADPMKTRKERSSGQLFRDGLSERNSLKDSREGGRWHRGARTQLSGEAAMETEVMAVVSAWRADKSVVEVDGVSEDDGFKFSWSQVLGGHGQHTRHSPVTAVVSSCGCTNRQQIQHDEEAQTVEFGRGISHWSKENVLEAANKCSFWSMTAKHWLVPLSQIWGFEVFCSP